MRVNQSKRCTIDHQLNFKVKGFLAWQVQAGQVFGSVP